MTNSSKISNRLIHESSPYLLQHAHNPVDWWPWCEEAFVKAKQEDKPIFLSIGYSTCHWCHVMEDECFEDSEVAELLNRDFISVKVDKEERPDIDSVYMNVCQAFTGSGGWPMTIIMTPNAKPFFAGTYFPKHKRYGSIGLMALLPAITEKWLTEREDLIRSGNEMIRILNKDSSSKNMPLSDSLVENAADLLKQTFDKEYGGFGQPPKFPVPHNLLFLLDYYEISRDKACIEIVEKTLKAMYKGGIFDHIGYGFSRYSTDKYWLAPHFEKMLYDNALLTFAYLRAFEVTGNIFYKTVAVKTMDYVLRELTSPEGGFYSAQDADSDGIEGKHYIFTPDEIITLLGSKDGEKFNDIFDITPKGNFEGKNIPNLIKTHSYDHLIEQILPVVYEYRRQRTSLHKDDKILCSWNALMISAFALGYRLLRDKKYLNAAENALQFIENHLSDNDKLFVSFRDGKRAENGFLDDYAFYIFALINMYQATFDKHYIDKAISFAKKALSNFSDKKNGGFFLYGNDGEQLITRPKETYDGAVPSGNSVMAYDLYMLAKLSGDGEIEKEAQRQFDFMAAEISNYPVGHSFFMFALLKYLHPPKEIVCVLKNRSDLSDIHFPPNALVRIKETPTQEYTLKNDRTTFYICEGTHCLPPVNTLNQ